MSPLSSEKTVQELFYEQFNLPHEAMQYNCDGYHNGCLLEFKKSNRTSINAALFQAVKYLSSFRVRGIPVPARILLVFPSIKTVYLVQSEKYFADIHKLYHDSASRNTKNWKKQVTDYETINYAKPEGIARLNQLLHEDEPQWLKVTIDEHCVVSWAQTFYRLNPKAKKEDFLYESDDLFITHRGKIPFRNETGILSLTSVAYMPSSQISVTTLNNSTQKSLCRFGLRLW